MSVLMSGLVKGLASDAMRRDTEDIHDAVAEVVDEYVAGLEFPQVLEKLSEFYRERPDLFEYLEFFPAEDFESTVKVTLYEVIERAVLEVIEKGADTSAPVPEYRDSDLQVFIKVKEDKEGEFLEKVKEVFKEGNTVDLESAFKIITGKNSAIVVQKMPEQGSYRIYKQGDDEVSVKEYFRKVYNSVKEADYSLDPRDYVGGKKAKVFSVKEAIIGLIELNNAMVKNGRAVKITL